MPVLWGLLFVTPTFQTIDEDLPFITIPPLITDKSWATPQQQSRSGVSCQSIYSVFIGHRINIVHDYDMQSATGSHQRRSASRGQVSSSVCIDYDIFPPLDKTFRQLVSLSSQSASTIKLIKDGKLQKLPRYSYYYIPMYTYVEIHLSQFKCSGNHLKAL